jgi:hypothetical protein
MDVRRVLAVIATASEGGCDAFGLAVRVAADTEAHAVERMRKAAADLGLAVVVDDEPTIESLVCAIVLAAQTSTEG